MFSQLPRKYNLFLIVFLVTRITATMSNDDDTGRHHKKRQIYREQVLPHAGGRIPDAAFETDRLFLNRLQKEGIAVPDGIVLEQRNPQVHPFYNKLSRTVFHIALSSDARYTPREGRYLYKKNEIPTVETTYLYPQVHGQNSVLHSGIPAFPVYQQFRLHNPQLNQLKFQDKKKQDFRAKTGKSDHIKLSKAMSYQNFNIINKPFGSIGTGTSILDKSIKIPLAKDKPLLTSPASVSPVFLSRNYDNDYLVDDFDKSSKEANVFSEFENIFSELNLYPNTDNPLYQHLFY